ncbi:putative methyltransferase-domain-containing protein [Glomus cerebriforme]|uniref:Putative methyltransferase-domain-containing protein n=1 Tax=Glomus cerebriforme TaxID=658196 RepID=A0A397SE28_9GLOM|nr:putative methyltransferase-domain-containing protein [Glomus cerebriforme]
MSDISHPQHFSGSTSTNKNTSTEIVLWKYDNPYANYKHDPERIFLINGYTLQIYQKLNDIISITQNTGNIVWDGAYILSKFIIDHLLNDFTFRENVHDIKATAPRNSVQKKIRFLELGSGCGLVGLSAWILGGYVVCSELPGEEFEHTKLNIESNVQLILHQQEERFKSEFNPKNESELNIRLRKDDITAYPLNWEELPQDSPYSSPFDIILASEILYLPHLHKSLVKIIKYFSHSISDNFKDKKEKRKTLVLGIYKDRGLGEPAFFDIANKFGKMKVIWINNNWIIKEFNNYFQEYKMFWLIPFE